MAQITVYAQGTQNWDTASGWNSAANGSGTAYTDPQNGANTFICDLNGKVVTLNKDVTVDQIIASDGTGYLTVSGTRTINVSDSNGIYYTGTSTSGMVRIGASANLTVNGQVTKGDGAGYCIVGSSDAILTVDNSDCTTADSSAVYVMGNTTGRVISWGATGNLTIHGTSYYSVRTNGSAAAYAIYVTSTCTIVINGDMMCAGTSSGARRCFQISTGTTATITINGNLLRTANGFTVYLQSGTCTINGNISTDYSTNNVVYGTLHTRDTAVCILNGTLVAGVGPWCISMEGGNLYWTGVREIASDAYVAFYLVYQFANLYLVTESSKLDLTINGSLFIHRMLTSGIFYEDAGAGSAVIRKGHTKAGFACINAPELLELVEGGGNFTRKPIQIGM